MPVPRATAQRLRLITGLVLFVFAATHLANHALGLVSLQAMETGRLWFLGFWRSVPGTVLLAGAAAGHVGLVLWKLARGRGVAMPAWEWAQLLLGLAIPVLLTVHVLGTRGVHEVFGIDDSYARVLSVLWPDGAWRQTLLTLVVWAHGCIGLHFWLRLQRWYARAVPLLYAGALLLPVLALTGFVVAGRAVAAGPDGAAALADAPGWPGPAAAAFVYRTEAAVVWGFLALVGALAALRLVRLGLERRRGTVRLTYPDGRAVVVVPGTSVLEASRMAGVPHAAVCGGRGRCSTCRVRVGAGADLLPPPDAEERRVLDRIGAPDSVRLACRLRPAAALAVAPLFPPSAGPRDVRGPGAYRHGAELEVAILFADLRAFTRLAERRLPYDVVFLLNQYFREMGRAVERAGGHVDKFVGDGVMALFGIAEEGQAPHGGGRVGGEAGARAALVAVRNMAAALEALNRALAHDLPEPLRIGIGVHAGPVIVGEMGYGAAVSLTAIGDAVNVASRLEAMTKDFACQAVISESVARRAAVDLSAFPAHEVRLRGRERPLVVYAVADAAHLPVPAVPSPASGRAR
ncbi:MAG: adenylate/guanylate cyclase domain-containing protein [Alphaproteobacteria bacterium]